MKYSANICTIIGIANNCMQIFAKLKKKQERKIKSVNRY